MAEDRWLESVTDSMDMDMSKLQESGRQRSLECCSPWGGRVRHDIETRQNHKPVNAGREEQFEIHSLLLSAQLSTHLEFLSHLGQTSLSQLC